MTENSKECCPPHDHTKDCTTSPCNRCVNDDVGVTPTFHPLDEKKKELKEVLNKAMYKAIGGGVPGALAMGLQVTSLMWMRTTMNYQYRHGGTTTNALRTLYADGGVRRFYRGYGPAIFQGPLSRFGDTAANAGVLALVEDFEATKNLPVGVKTAIASATAALWRIFLMPIDTTKTILQVEGAEGLSVLRAKIAKGGVPVLYSGALGAASATAAGHFPWFFTFNWLNSIVPKVEPGVENAKIKTLARSALLGFCSSAVSDTVSNSLRVLKTTKQTSREVMSYPQALRTVVDADGLMGLFGRGLKTRLMANGVQGLAFAVLWKEIQGRLFPDQ